MTEIRNPALSTRRRVVGLAMLAACAALSLPAIEASAASPLHWAVSDGVGLVRGSGVSSFTKIGTGIYEVTFNSNVSACAYVATTQVLGAQARIAYTAGGHLGPNGVYVEVKNQGGGLSDGPFHVLAACDATGSTERHAVVGYTANLVRASAGTTLTSLGGGKYSVRFSRKVTSCAHIATVGDPANALVFNPSAAYTGTDPGDPFAVYVETKNPGGGLQAGVPFHLALVCPDKYFRIAVVSANGIPARTSSRTSSYMAPLGEYTISSDRDLGNCAWLATRGDTGKQVPFSPTTVEVRPGPSSNTFDVQQRSLLFFGGALADQEFHSIAAC